MCLNNDRETSSISMWSTRPISLRDCLEMPPWLFFRSISMSSVWRIVGSPKVQWNLGTDGQVENTLLLNVPFCLYMRTLAMFRILAMTSGSNTVIFSYFSSSSARSLASYACLLSSIPVVLDIDWALTILLTIILSVSVEWM